MAQFDLKDATIKIRDGGVSTVGAVNQAQVTETDAIASASLGVNTVTVAALSQAFYRGRKFTIESDTTEYTLRQDAASGATAIFFDPPLAVAIVADKDIVFAAGAPKGTTKIDVDGWSTPALEALDTFNLVGSDQDFLIGNLSGATPTWIEFSPPLDIDVLDNAVITAKKDHNEIELNIGEGNITYAEKQAIEYILNRGKLSSARRGDEEPMDVAFDFVWEQLRSVTGEIVTPEEAIKRIGRASHWRTTDGDTCAPYACDIEIRYAPTCDSDTQVESILLPDFRWESMDHDASNGTVSCSGKCHAVQASVVREA